MPGGLTSTASRALPHGRLIGPHRTTAEDRHDDQPAIGELVVAHDRVAVVERLALAAEALEHVVRVHRAVQHLARRVELLALLREDRHARVHGLHDVIGADGERVVGRVAQRGRALRPLEADAEPVEARDERRRRPRARLRLFDGAGTLRRRDDRRRDGRRRGLLWNGGASAGRGHRKGDPDQRCPELVTSVRLRVRREERSRCVRAPAPAPGCHDVRAPAPAARRTAGGRGPGPAAPAPCAAPRAARCPCP